MAHRGACTDDRHRGAFGGAGTTARGVRTRTGSAGSQRIHAISGMCGDDAEAVPVESPNHAGAAVVAAPGDAGGVDHADRVGGGV